MPTGTCINMCVGDRVKNRIELAHILAADNLELYMEAAGES